MSVVRYFLHLYQEKKQVALLAWAYAIIMVISTLIAGLVALFDQSLGVGLLIVPLIALVAFSVNILMWAMVRFIIESAGIRIAEKHAAPLRKLGHEATRIANKSDKHGRK